ncbi:Lipoprotein SPR [Ignavibacterium album JCM 16511]|uniref:Lipoprotein SPR n=1 Tax=Ignavibacterium album (strain DSM 19864 / JCM 16511 / NBRC 101810 / Mat9-16) TaxID=945713 RepID=I0AI52_IGNAJ|nr:C40 family peptidase [Ignavibacterium album]AFH48659.1 Lipoprotein SPR [Ignavibacterium album JCM 16511]
MSSSLKYLLLINLLLIHFGCSPSSQTIRYGKENKSLANQDSTESGDTLLYDDSDEIAEYLDPDDMPEEKSSYNISDIMKKLEKTDNLNTEQATAREKLLMEIIKYLDTPYKYGGSTLNGIDCSAFTQSVYQDALNVNLNRTARDQFTQGRVIKNKDELEFGDLVFFNTRRRVRPGHVGIYIGDGLFAHASTKGGVMISSLDEDYYSKRYMGARRVVEDDTF